MGSGFISLAQGLFLLLVTASSMLVSVLSFPNNYPNMPPNFPNWPPNPNPNWPPIFSHRPPKQTHKIINVGGSDNWRFGFNYTDWSFRNGPFFLKDTLVFKYDPPNSTTFPHSVYLVRDFWSFQRCDLRKAKMIGNLTQGGGDGFKFVLKRWQPYYFVCGERNGVHCNIGMMKLAVFPIPRWPYAR